MHLQIETLNVQLDEISARAQSLVTGMLPDDKRLSPEPDCWPVAQCLEHLTLSSDSFLPVISKAREQAREDKVVGVGPYQMDKLGRLLNWTMRPPARIKVRTSENFQPIIIEPLE